MPIILNDISRTLGEYLLIPRLTTAECIPDNVNLRTPIVRFQRGQTPSLQLNVPFSSAIMQAVSGEKLAIELARAGGLSFIFCSQSIESQASMIRKVKKYKAGFVVSDSNVKPDSSINEMRDVQKDTGHSTLAVTQDGTPNGKLIGLITARDSLSYGGRNPSETALDVMTPIQSLPHGQEGISLNEAHNLIRHHKVDVLPILSSEGNLVHFVFRKDYESNMAYPEELLDQQKSLMVGAGVNTRDYQERIPALVDAGADVLCIDSSDGYSVWQAETVAFVRKKYGDNVKIGAGNVVDAEGFEYLAAAGADFVKVGVGGGAICITREQKGIGRGQASALIEVCNARDQYFQKTGTYVPVCSDGGIVHDYHTIIALALGADFLMLGRYFARFEESPTSLVKVNSNLYKEYWGEGSNRARNWQRYDHGDTNGAKEGLIFEEGVDSYVPYAGRLRDGLQVTLAKLKSTMCNCGSLSLSEFNKNAKLTLVSPLSLIEGGSHDVVLRNEVSDHASVKGPKFS